MKIGLVGPSYEQRSKPFDAQRTINFYPVFDQMGKEVAALYGTPGLNQFAEAGGGPIRGAFRSANGRVFFVSGATLYEVDSAAIVTNRGSMTTSSGTVSMAEGSTQLAVCDGDKLFYLTYASNGFSQVSDGDFPSSVGYVANIDGYFVVNENDTGKYFISANDDVSSWAALDFATAEGSPDKLVAPINAVGQLWLFGDVTTEVWTNTGASSFPFARISGAVMETGLLAKHSAIEIDNTVMWLGKDEFGQGIVYRASGFTPRRVSTTPIEKRIQAATSPEDMVAYAYQEEGHLFYVLTGGGLKTTLVYDLTTQQWHERAYLNGDGQFEQHLANCHVFAFGKHLVGDRLSGRIYEMSLDYYTDNGEEMASERIYTHISQENKRIRYNQLEVGVETGVGLQSGNGSDPMMSMQISRDGGRTWSSWVDGSIGAAGQFETRVVWRRLGVAPQLTFKIRITDPVKRAITGSYLQ